MWNHLIKKIYALQAAFSNKRTFYWFIAVVIGFCTRTDTLGDTSIIRALSFSSKSYTSLMNFFNSSSINLEKLTKLWINLAIKLLDTYCYKVNGRRVFIGDGIKISKEGKKMPGVKSIHQESENNSKPEFIMGHSIQVFSLLVGKGFSFFAVPLVGRIHEGVKTSNFDKKTLVDKMADFFSLPSEPFYVVLDAYYRKADLVRSLFRKKSHLVIRLKRNSVAYEKIGKTSQKKKRGRPALYGKKIKLVSFFKEKANEFFEEDSPVYGERDVKIKLYSRDLVWRTLGSVVRFVWVVHPKRGSMILLSTDTELKPIEIIKMYGLRFKIEVSFKSMIQCLGTFDYHFWMKGMKKIKRKSKGQYIHKESKKYRDKVFEKMRCYNLHMQVAFVAQGLMQYLSIAKTDFVWSSFNGFVRTIREHIVPSEMIVSMALRESLSEFLKGEFIDGNLKKFIFDKRRKMKDSHRLDNNGLDISATG